MKKIYVILLFWVACTAGVCAQGMRTLFVEAADTLFPLLTATNKVDCIDFIDAGMRARVTNKLDGKSELVTITHDYLLLRSSGSSTVEMKMLPFAGDTVIAVVRSVSAEASDSRITFYNRDWSVAPVTFEKPAIKDFFVASDSAEYYMRLCDIYLVKLSLSPSDDSLVAEYTMPAYMNPDEAAAVRRFLLPVRFRWSARGFVRE